MCGRYASARSVDDIAAAFGIRDDRIEVAAAADWNVAPTKDVRAVLDRGDGPVLTSLRWGLVPSWVDDPSIGSRLINARAETVAEKSAFRGALAVRRCLLPADGWYEWASRPDGSRQAYYLTPPDGTLLAFAGLWETWYDADGRPMTTATIVTGAAPTDVVAVHDRAPIVMPPTAWTTWLDRRSSLEEVHAVLRPTPPGTVAVRPVGPSVGDVRANGPSLVDEVAVDEQPSLF
jgi:putative SOS response-associated peptidase YedK